MGCIFDGASSNERLPRRKGPAYMQTGCVRTPEHYVSPPPLPIERDLPMHVCVDGGVKDTRGRGGGKIAKRLGRLE